VCAGKLIGRRKGSNPLDADGVVELVEGIARGLPIAGELELRGESYEEAPVGKVRHSDIHVSSSRQGCCPITITLFEDGKSAGWLTISFGASYCEIWGKPRRETVSEARDLLTAVMEGRLEVWRKPDDRDGEDVYGLLVARDGTVLHDDFGRTSPDDLEHRGYVRRLSEPY